MLQAYHNDLQVVHEMLTGLMSFVTPLLERLDEHMDKRLVRTIPRLLRAMLVHRHREHGLLLSELGSYIIDDAHGPAGTKRVSNLLRSPHWDHCEVDDYLWEQADACVADETAAGRQALLVWDEGVLEKSETEASPDLCAVRSSKAARKLRRRPGFGAPPTFLPVFVPGLAVLALLVIGADHAPLLAHLRCWTRRGAHAESGTEVAATLFAQTVHRWGSRVLHVCDRGYSSAAWVGRFLAAEVPFIVRWRADYKLLAAQGVRRPGDISRHKRSLDSRLLQDPRHHTQRQVGILYFPVRHPSYPDQPLWLVVGRPQGYSPWYFLTNQPVESLDAAWHILFTYVRRWQVEMTFRFLKSELALESPRLQFWENRLKLLALVALLYAYLVSLLAAPYDPARRYLFDHFCKRTGTKLRRIAQPLYRLRLALSRLLLCYPLQPLWQNSG
jgi:hypothetical protein